MNIKRGILTLFIAIAAFTSNSPAQQGAISMHGTLLDSGATGTFSTGFPKDAFIQPMVFIGDDRRVYRVVFENDRLAALFIDGVQVTPERIADDPANDRKLANFLEIRKESARLEEQEAGLDEEDSALDVIENLLEKKEDEADRIQDSIEDDEEMLEDERDKSTRDNIRKSIDKKREKFHALRREIEQQQAEIDAKREQIDARAKVVSARLEEFSTTADREMDKVLDRIVTDLRTANVLAASGKVSFKLTNKELIVNGKSAPRDVFERLKQVYVGDDPRGTFGYLYNWKLNWR